MNTVTVGNVEIRPLLDTGLLMNPHYFIPDHAEEALAGYPELVNERGMLQASITCYLIRSEGRTILVDTGLGNRRRPDFPRGHLDESLQAAGVEPGDIELIVHTHLHVDHVGWNTVETEGEPRIFFPNARYVAQKADWDFWMQPEKIAAQDYLRQCVQPVADAGLLRLAEGEEALDSALTLVPTPGHTPGHMAIGIYSAGERALLIGDASHFTMQLDHPDWSPVADIDPQRAAQTRERLMDEAIADGKLWLAGHWPYPGIGRLVRVENRRVFQAL